MNIPDTEKKIKQHISSYKSSLNKEKKTYGSINDGAGKRYLLFCLYFLLGDLKKSSTYIEWYENEFPDDSGEPIQILCWAIMLYQMGKTGEAKIKLAELMLSNLYFIPKIIGIEIPEYNMWHSSNDCESDYFEYTPSQILDNLSVTEIKWISQLYNSSEFIKIRNRYVEIFTELKDVKDVACRRVLLEESYKLLSILT